MSILYPSAQVTLAMRVEELAEDQVLKEKLQSSVSFAKIPSGLNPADTASKIAELNAELREVLQEPETPGRAQRAQSIRNKRDALRAAQRIGPGSRIEAIDGGSPDARFGRSGIIPMSCSVARNGFRTADTASIQLNWKDVPFDPRIVRAAGVELTIGVVSGDDFAKGFKGQLGDRGLPLSTIDVAPGGKLDGSFTQFVGWVDDWAINFGSDSDTVTLECRDYTALFIDTFLLPNDGIDLEKPLIEGIQEFIDGEDDNGGVKYPTVAGISVVFGDVGEAPGAAPGAPGKNIPPQAKSRKGKKAKRKRSGNQRMSLWDHITDVTVAFGFVPIIRGYELRIINPRTRLSSKGNPRRMVFGRNLESLDFDRKLGGNAVSIVEVRAYDPSVDKVRWARWPVASGQPSSGFGGTTADVLKNRPPKAFPNVPTPSGSKVDEKVTIFTLDSTVIGIGSLEALARQMFNQIARQEIEGNFATREVSSWNIKDDEPLPATDADLLQLRSGDPIELLVAPRDPRFPAETPNTTSQLAELPTRSRTQFLINLGYDPEVAKQVARLQEAAGFQTIFRAQDVQIEMDHDDGISVKVDFINYVTVREDAIQDRSPGDVAQDVANAASSPALDKKIIGSGEGAENARTAQKQRRVDEQRREEGSITTADLTRSTQAEKEAVRGAGGSLGD
jgi:hypothetical protein